MSHEGLKQVGLSIPMNASMQLVLVFYGCTCDSALNPSSSVSFHICLFTFAFLSTSCDSIPER